MTKAELERKLNIFGEDFFVTWNDSKSMKELLTLLYNHGYTFLYQENFDMNKPCEDLQKDVNRVFYGWYKWNTKPVLHVFYRFTKRQNEMQFTTHKEIEKDYLHRHDKVYCYVA